MRYLSLYLFSILTVIGLSANTVVQANTQTQPTKTYLAQKPNCNDPQTQLEINICSQLSYQNADKKLNQVYKQLLPKLSKTRQQKLIAAQLAWIKFRDASCEFERSAYEGGSIAPAIYAGCLEEATKQRTQQLREYLQHDG
ncbi:lysozyme inhibitor LprI family protein [Nostoc sp. FACHB-87]|uniref:lysozyme inhibitor LprI family protein n=1 Tax=Nostocales TaxID=1161 RepID=UPI001684C78D|nr:MULTISPECIES: lysozyme inhibitor LprI family protein [Nostocales]MBD2456287.1 lysozyme inhibitor LprI family protein [Nostoc sp. FACHB-87]MBD2477708.1 lysozyme inhibitor LprI family protein [Anabaena sp. FACHB-83]MBD2486738.1 lysozyme inhibitor LprI family protein [Aulosira sp. FACHB-615]